LFGSRDTISNLVQGVVVPNVSLRGEKYPPFFFLFTSLIWNKEHDVEQFEDDPLEFIRRDLTVTSSADVATRRHAASDVLQALVSSGFEADTTEIVGQRINAGLQEYSANPSEGWRAKDSAVYLLTAIATRGSTAQVGVVLYHVQRI
jgi:exportin-2 (importin alpha re-exporter)